MLYMIFNYKVYDHYLGKKNSKYILMKFSFFFYFHTKLSFKEDNYCISGHNHPASKVHIN